MNQYNDILHSYYIPPQNEGGGYWSVKHQGRSLKGDNHVWEGGNFLLTLLVSTDF
mgnify:CR=1 FL=1